MIVVVWLGCWSEEQSGVEREKGVRSAATLKTKNSFKFLYSTETQRSSEYGKLPLLNTKALSCTNKCLFSHQSSVHFFK